MECSVTQSAQHANVTDLIPETNTCSRQKGVKLDRATACTSTRRGSMKWKLVLAVACAFLPHATEAKKNCVASHAFDASLLQVKKENWPIFLETYTCEQSNVTALAAKHAEGLPIKCWLSDGNADFNTASRKT